MPKSRPVTLQILCNEKKTISEQLHLSQWEKSDGMLRAGISGGAVLLVAMMMIPIPIVHFAAIPVLLLGLPIVPFFTFKMYSKGTDLQGSITCPECLTQRTITRSVAYWPVTLQCLECKNHLTISQIE